MNHVCFTAVPDGAGLAAELTAGEGAPRVYAVEPTGAFENDPHVSSEGPTAAPRVAYARRTALQQATVQRGNETRRWR